MEELLSTNNEIKKTSLQDISNTINSRYPPLEPKHNKKFSLLCDLFEKVSVSKTTLKIKYIYLIRKCN